MKIVNLTRELYREFEGEYPQMTIRGIAAIKDGKVVGILGVSKVMAQNFVICGISDVSPREIIKTWRYFSEKFMDKKETYYSIIDDDMHTAVSFNNHFGFVHLKDNIYVKRF